MIGVFLLPLLVAPFGDSGIPGALEIHRGTFILKGFPDAGGIAAMKKAHITHVLSICRDGDAGFDPDKEGHALAEVEILFSRVSLKRAPTSEDFELFRTVRNSLPRNAKVLIHCTDGNRAAVVAVAWLAAEGLVERGEAVALARRAGMIHPDTEKALLDYLGRLP